MRRLLFLFTGCMLLSLCAEAQQNAGAPPSNAAQAVRANATAPAQSGTAVENEADPLFDLPPLPKAQVSLIGGTVDGVDRVRYRLTVRAFEGQKIKLDFDERTHIYRDGTETTQLGIRKGDRVYVDSQLVGSRLFARNIRINSAVGTADTQGQIEAYDPARGTMLVRDTLSSEAVSFRVTRSTAVTGKATSIGDLQRGALVKVRFAPAGGDGRVANQIVVTARPGENFKFAGHVTFIDLRSGALALQNQTDNKNYEIRFDPSNPMIGNISVGSEITVEASFDGSGYTATDIKVTPTKQAQKQ